MPRLVGLSLSFCIKDIIRGNVREEDVVRLVTATSAPNRRVFEKVLAAYRRAYWYVAPKKATYLARRMWRKGMIEQPRLKTGKVYACHSIAEGHWQTETGEYVHPEDSRKAKATRLK